MDWGRTPFHLPLLNPLPQITCPIVVYKNRTEYMEHPVERKIHNPGFTQTYSSEGTVNRSDPNLPMNSPLKWLQLNYRDMNT